MNELTQVDLLNNDSALFNIEFNNLKKFYTLNNEKEIWDFIKIHPGVIVLLNAYEQSLKKYFTGAVFELKFNPDLSGSWFDLIALTVWVDEETFNKVQKLLDKNIRPMKPIKTHDNEIRCGGDRRWPRRL